jgi:hypothetical protein
MKTIGFIVGVAIVGLLLLIGSSFISASNDGARFEATIKAKYQNAQNIRANYGQKVLEAAQVPGMYAEDLKKITDSAITGRYGAEGSKAVFQMIKEQNPTIDAKMYTKIQQIIEAGRDEFKNAQAMVLDARAVYETQLGLFWKGFWLKMAGFPKVAMSTYDPVVTADVAQSFETKRETAPVQLRAK